MTILAVICDLIQSNWIIHCVLHAPWAWEREVSKQILMKTNMEGGEHHIANCELYWWQSWALKPHSEENTFHGTGKESFTWAKSGTLPGLRWKKGTSNQARGIWGCKEQFSWSYWALGQGVRETGREGSCICERTCVLKQDVQTVSDSGNEEVLFLTLPVGCGKWPTPKHLGWLQENQLRLMSLNATGIAQEISGSEAKDDDDMSSLGVLINYLNGW